jgi:hypothetical protein
MMDTIRNYLRGAYDATMWIMEFFVLCLIAYEVWIAIRRKRRLKNRTAEILIKIEDGQHLLDAYSRLSGNAQDIDAWIDKLEGWEGGSSAMLSKYSPQASIIFTSGIPASHYVDVMGPGVEANRRRDELIVRLERLRSVMENHETYL